MFDWRTFMQHVTNANPQFSAKHSSLKHLIFALERPLSKVKPGWVIDALVKLKPAKRAQYQAAVNYVWANIPNLPPTAVPQGAVVTNFRQTFKEYRATDQAYAGYDLNNLATPPVFVQGLKKHHFIFTLKWESSDGNLASLATVYTREHVQFLSDPTQPPFNYIYQTFKDQHPTLGFSQPDKGGNPANGGSNDDDHSSSDPRVLVSNPRQVGMLVAHQSYQYNSTDTQRDDHWIDIPNGQFLLQRSVLRRGNDWYFRFGKINAEENVNKFRYAHDVKIEPTGPMVPRVLKDLTL